MRGATPTIHCDGDDGLCEAWGIDNYEATVSTVDGFRVTYYERAPGWFSNHVYDYCPEHHPERSLPTAPTTHRPEESPDE